MATAAVFRAKNDSNSIETAINDWLTNNSASYSTIDDIEITHEQAKGGFVTVCVIYTA